MRSHTLPLIGSILLGLALPLSASAYTTPDQVLLQDAFMNNFTPPPKPSQGSARVTNQRQTSADRRAAEQSAYFAAQQSSTSSESTHDAAPDGSSDPQMTQVLQSLQASIDKLNSQQDSTDTARNQRILDRVARQQTLADVQNALGLHSGAPLDQLGSGKGGTPCDGKGPCCDSKGPCTINSGAPLNESGPATWFLVLLACSAIFWTLKKATALSAMVPSQDGTSDVRF